MVSLTHKEVGFEHASGACEMCFEFTPPRRMGNALVASKPNIVSLVNAGTIQVVKTL